MFVILQLRNATDKIEQLINRGFPEVPMIISHKAAMADRMLGLFFLQIIYKFLIRT